MWEKRKNDQSSKIGDTNKKKGVETSNLKASAMTTTTKWDLPKTSKPNPLTPTKEVDYQEKQEK